MSIFFLFDPRYSRILLLLWHSLQPYLSSSMLVLNPRCCWIDLLWLTDDPRLLLRFKAMLALKTSIALQLRSTCTSNSYTSGSHSTWCDFPSSAHSQSIDSSIGIDPCRSPSFIFCGELLLVFDRSPSIIVALCHIGCITDDRKGPTICHPVPWSLFRG